MLATRALAEDRSGAGDGAPCCSETDPRSTAPTLRSGSRRLTETGGRQSRGPDALVVSEAGSFWGCSRLRDRTRAIPGQSDSRCVEVAVLLLALAPPVEAEVKDVVIWGFGRPSQKPRYRRQRRLRDSQLRVATAFAPLRAAMAGIEGVSGVDTRLPVPGVARGMDLGRC